MAKEKKELKKKFFDEEYKEVMAKVELFTKEDFEMCVKKKFTHPQWVKICKHINYEFCEKFREDVLYAYEEDPDEFLN